MPGPADTSKLYFQRGDGSVVGVHPDDAQTAESYGWKPVDPGKVQETAAANSLGGKVKTFAESAASGAYDAATAIPRLYLAAGQAATGLALRGAEAAGVEGAGEARQLQQETAADLNAHLTGRQLLADIYGLSQEIAGAQNQEAAAKQQADAQRLRADVNPATAFIGSATGQALVAAPFGLGGAGKAAAESLASRGVASPLARMLGSALAGAAEGAPIGAIAAEDQAFIEDRKLTGEQILASAGLGALLGGTFSFVASGAGEALGAAKTKVTQALERAPAAKAETVAVEGATDAAANAAPKEMTAADMTKALARANDEDIANYAANTMGVTPSPKFAETFRETVKEGSASTKQRLVAESTEQLTKDARTLLESQQALREVVDSVPLKRERVAEMLARDGIGGEVDEASHISSLGDVSINDSGMREDSMQLARDRVGKDRPIEIAQFPGEKPFLQDGRHRIAAAAEAGQESVPAKIRIYDSEGNTVKLIDKRISLSESARPSNRASIAIQSARDVASSTRAELESLLTDSQAGRAANRLDAFKGLLTTTRRLESEIANAKTAADANIALDRMRADSLKVLTSLNEALTRTTDPNIEYGLRKLVPELNRQYLGLASNLSDESIWGAAGTAQKAINTAYVDLIKASDAGIGMIADRMRATDLNLDTGRMLPRFDVNEGKVSNMVAGFGTPTGAVTERRFRDYVGALKRWSDAIGEHVELEPSKAAALQSLRKSTESIEKTFTTVSENASAINQVKHFLEQAHNAGHRGASLGAMAGGALGSLAGPAGAAAGSAIGGALGASTNPAALIVQRMQIETVARRARDTAGKLLDSFFAPISKGAAKVAEPVAAALPGAVARLPSAIDAFQGKHATPQAAYRARVEELQDAAANFSGGARDATAKAFGHLATTDPHVVASVTVAATRGIQFLLGKMPVDPAFNPESMTPFASKAEPNRAELHEFADYWHAVQNPMSVLKDLAKGNASPQQVEALQAVYPSFYQWIRLETMARIRELDRKGIEIPIRKRMLLDTLLDLNGAGERTFSPKFVSTYSQMMGDTAEAQRSAAQPHPRPGPTKLASRLATGTTTMLGGQ